MSGKTWPTLYKKNSNGSIQQWTISIAPITGGSYDGLWAITKEYGQVGGAIQISAPDIISGKNIGKANETTPRQQAELEAQAQWTKKKTGPKCYVESIDDADAGKVDDLIEGGVTPMLAKTYGTIINEKFTPDAAKKIVFPAFAQHKLNGHRCAAIVAGGVCTLWTRTRKPIVSMPHIVADIESMCSELGLSDWKFDGELYNHDYADKLEDLSSLIRPEYAKPGSEVVQYHIYDAPIAGSFEARWARISGMFETLDAASQYGHLVLCDTRVVHNHDELVAMFDEWRRDGYEGAIVRNAAGEYESKRSWGLQKLKGWLSKEFEIVGINEGRGKMAGKAVLECVTGADDPIPNVQFDCSLAASMERRAEIFERPDAYIGKMLSIKFAYYTQDGKPFHLVGEAIRDYEEVA